MPGCGPPAVRLMVGVEMKDQRSSLCRNDGSRGSAVEKSEGLR